jgi:DNA (cytosine-5)-methyltransferase 1
MLTGVSLFAGVGGFDLAMTRKGIKVVATVEIDKKCNEVLARRFPEATQFTDVQQITGKDLIDAGFDPARGIITGGFPCQDLSVAGKRAGLAGARSGLFWEIRRLVEETQTEWFVLENVPGLLSSNSGKDFGIVLGEMANLGYSLGWRVLDAQYFGVPQRRRRVFIVGSRTGGAGSIGKVLFEREGVRRNTTSSQQEGQDTTNSTATSTRSAMLGSGKDIANTIPAELYHHGTVVNQDANNGHVVIENPIVGTLQARDYKGVGNQYVAENKLVVEQVTQSAES